MKLSWKDAMTTVIALLGGAVVYAKFYDFSWAVIGSWRSSVAIMALVGIGMFAFSTFDFANRSVLNIGEMVLGLAAIALAVTGVFMASEFVFYSLAAVLGVLWLVDTARHARHSMRHEDTTSFHHHAAAH